MTGTGQVCNNVTNRQQKDSENYSKGKPFVFSTANYAAPGCINSTAASAAYWHTFSTAACADPALGRRYVSILQQLVPSPGHMYTTACAAPKRGCSS
jgi:hypothetical protein